RLQCLPQFIADLLSCHANNNAQPPAFDDLVLLATLRRPRAKYAGGAFSRCGATEFRLSNPKRHSSWKGKNHPQIENG
ncbi:hypothetical protein, partial [Ralstonia pseudosolanacearum]|uniref:hypothetical protein n=1 Tax=Ralstonia pseudosolanacearum TaxID=1310165 RepID=UPI001E3893C1